MPSTFCMRHAPIAVPEASECTSKGRSKSGLRNTGALTRASFNLSNACWCLSVHSNLQSLRVRDVKGAAMVAYPLMLRLKKPLAPRKPRTSLTLRGHCISLMAFTFSGSGATPSAETIKPKSLMLFAAKLHLLAFNLKPAPFNKDKVSPRSLT